MDASLPAQSPTPTRLDQLLRHAEYLRALARRLARDDSEAEDLVQETWTAAVEQPERDVRNPRSWLAGVVRNLARQKRRGAGRRARREVVVARDEGTESTENIVERVEIFRELAHEVVALDEPYRSTLIQLYFQGLDAETIAARSGEPAATVRSRHKRALEKLRARLDERRGGRDAWRTALLPWLGPTQREPSPRIARPKALRWALGGGLALVIAGSVFLLVRAPAPPPSRVREFAQAPSTPPSSAATPLSAPRSSERNALADSVARGPLALRLVDARTHAPLSDFVLTATDIEERSESMKSDAQGRIRSGERFAAGGMTFALVDEPELARWRDRPRQKRSLPASLAWVHAADGAERELAIAVGPSFELELQASEVLERLRELRALDAAGSPSSGATDSRSRPSIELALRSTQPVPRVPVSLAPLRLHDDGRPWVRFAAEALAVDGPGPWLVSVLERERASADARRAGHLELSTRDEDSPPRLSFQLAPCGSLRIDARDARGRQRDTSILELVALDAAPGPLWRPLRSPRDPALWEGLWRGRYQVRVRGETSLLAASPAEVVPGERTELALAVGPAIGATIEGRVLFPRAPRARASSSRCARPTARRRCASSRASRTRARSRSSSTSSSRSSTSSARARPASIAGNASCSARPGGEPVVFVPELARDSANVVLWGLDAQSGSLVTHFRARLDFGAPERASTSSPRYDAEVGYTGFSLVPVHEPFEWTVIAEGYRPEHGDARALQLRPGGRPSSRRTCAAAGERSLRARRARREARERRGRGRRRASGAHRRARPRAHRARKRAHRAALRARRLAPRGRHGSDELDRARLPAPRRQRRVEPRLERGARSALELALSRLSTPARDLGRERASMRRRAERATDSRSHFGSGARALLRSRPRCRAFESRADQEALDPVPVRQRRGLARSARTAVVHARQDGGVAASQRIRAPALPVGEHDAPRELGFRAVLVRSGDAGIDVIGAVDLVRTERAAPIAQRGATSIRLAPGLDRAHRRQDRVERVARLGCVLQALALRGRDRGKCGRRREQRHDHGEQDHRVAWESAAPAPRAIDECG